MVMHHHSAAKYYKINVIVLLLFFGLSIYTYKFNPTVFWNDTFAKMYLGTLATGIFLLYLYSNKHIQSFYLLKKQQAVGIYTYTNFGFTYNRMIEVPIQNFKGSRLLWKPGMNLYQLEYNFKGKWTGQTKQRSFFYRPEHIADKELWTEIKLGNEILTEHNIENPKLLQKYKKRAAKKSVAMEAYRYMPK